MIVIGHLNEKGGVAKSTLAETLAAGLAMAGKRVVVVDADSQGTLTNFFGIQKMPGLYRLVVQKAPYERVLMRVPENFATLPNQDFLLVVPSDEATTMVFDDTQPDDLVLHNRIQELRHNVDVVILDTPPSPSKFHALLYMAMDWVIYPVELASAGVLGLQASMEHLENAQILRNRHGLNPLIPLGIVPTRCQLNTVLHTDMLAFLRGTYGDMVWDPIPNRIAWQEAQSGEYPQSIFEYAKRESSAAAAASEAQRFVDTVLECLDYV